MTWSPLPLADAILADAYPAPYALLAAWKCKYRGDCDDLTSLAEEAARRNAATTSDGSAVAPKT